MPDCCIDTYRSCILFQAVKLFVAAADELYGPITVLRRDGRTVKKIPWAAFKISEVDWIRVLDAKSILEVCSFSFVFSSMTYIEILRILIAFSNTSPPKNNPHCGAHSPQSKNCRQHGRKNATNPNMFYINRQSTTASQNSTNIILGSMRNRAIY